MATVDATTAATTAAADWSSVAAAWDASTAYVDEHSVESTAAFVAAVDVRPGDRVLELAAGPGSLGPTWAQRTGPTGRVVLSDFAPGMVEVARARNAGLAQVEVAVLDAAAIDRPDDSFDAVACRMGLMFTPDPAVALAEIRRVLVAGGRFAALTWGGIEHNPWMTCVGMAAMMNGVVAGGPPVGPGGIFSLSDPARLEALVEAAGFRDVAVSMLPATFVAGSIDEHLARVSSLAGPLAAAFASATPEQLAAVRATAAQLAADHTTESGVAPPGLALLVTGR
jgi:ubiquinone/menaquinone biosynthesis C-methylase UbiE